MERRERLAEFLVRLGAAPAASTVDDALALVGLTMTGVEDEHSGVANNPLNWRTDRRMYPPQMDSRMKQSPVPGTVCFRTIAHRVIIAENGAIAILQLSGDDEWIFEKAGRDGVSMPRPSSAA